MSISSVLSETAPTSYPSSGSNYPQSQGSGRLSRALLFALAPWLFLNTSMTNLSSFYHGNSQSNSHQTGQNFQYNLPQDIKAVHCVADQEWHSSQASPGPYAYSSQASFDLPVSSQTHFLIARGSQSGGSVDIITSPQQPQSSVTVQVVVNYSRKDVRNSVRLCRAVRGSGENGVGIFTPQNSNDITGQMEFATTIIIPEPRAGSSPLLLKNLETDVPNTSHRVQSLNNKASFNSISLSGSNQPIDVQSLSATTGSFRTSNGGITGSFDALSSLTLITKNGPINVNVGLHNNNGGPETRLDAQTSNSPLQASISLSSISGTRGSFGVTTTTSNANLDVQFATAPVNSRLNLIGSTTNSPAHVSLPSEYEGSFSLSSSPFSPPTINRRNSADPSRQGRRRNVQYHQVGNGQLEGTVSWGNGYGQGTVSVQTTQDASVLDL